MSSYDELSQLLDSVDAKNVSDLQPRTITFSQQDDQLVVEIVALDSMSCRAKSVRLMTTRFEQSATSELQQVASRLAAQLIYLLEPISLVEVDNDRVAVQLRSKPPFRDEGGTQYYELLVSPTGLSLCRYRGISGEPRQSMAMGFTREILVRLVDDFLCAVVPVS